MRSRVSASLARGAWRLGIVGALVVVSLVAAWCGSGAFDPGPSDSLSPGVSPASQSPDAGVLQFTAPRLGGGEVRGEDYAGRDVALWFWAPY